MARFNTPLNSFLAGEVSGKIIARTEVDQYRQTCEEITNMVVQPQGGAFKRPGTRYFGGTFQATTKSDSHHRHFPFIAANGKRFVIIARTVAGTGSNQDWQIVDLDAGTAQTPAVSTDVHTFTSAQIDEIQYAQSGDYVFFAHPAAIPFAIYYDGTNFFVSYLWDAFPGTGENWKRRPFASPELNNSNARGTLTPSATSGTITLTSSAGIFRSGHVGSMFKISDPGAGTKTGVVLVTAYTNSTTVTGVVQSTLPGTSAYGGTGAPTTSWEEQAWNGVRGYPRSVCLFQQRLYFGGTQAQPDTVWGSQFGDLSEFMYRPFEQSSEFTDFTKDNSRAYSFTVASTEANKIQWLSPGKTLTIGTASREYIAFNESGMGPVNLPTIQAQTSYGSAYIQPVRKDSFSYFVPRSYNSVRDFQYDNDQGVYKSNDITALNDHMIHKRDTALDIGKIRSIHLQPSNPGILWILDTNGGLSGITVNKDANVNAAHYHTIGGTNSKVLAMSVLPPGSSGWDSVFVSVRRTINSQSVLYFEELRKVSEYGPEALGDCYSDSSIITSGNLIPGPTQTFSGMSHLIGEAVVVMADGVYAGTQTVNGSGAVTVTGDYSQATRVFIGLPFKGRLVTSRTEAGSQIGSSQGLTKRIDQAVIRFFNTAYALFGRKEQIALDEVEFSDAYKDEVVSMGYNTASPYLFTGDKTLKFPAGYDRRAQIVIESSLPYPLGVSGIFLSGVTYD